MCYAARQAVAHRSRMPAHHHHFTTRRGGMVASSAQQPFRPSPPVWTIGTLQRGSGSNSGSGSSRISNDDSSSSSCCKGNGAATAPLAADGADYSRLFGKHEHADCILRFYHADGDQMPAIMAAGEATQQRRKWLDQPPIPAHFAVLAAASELLRGLEPDLKQATYRCSSCDCANIPVLAWPLPWGKDDAGATREAVEWSYTHRLTSGDPVQLLQVLKQAKHLKIEGCAAAAAEALRAAALQRGPALMQHGDACSVFTQRALRADRKSVV